MQRRTFMSRFATAASLAIFAGSNQSAQSDSGRGPALPRRERIRVAFMLGPGANVIDTAGPWEVFQDVMLGGSDQEEHSHPFELFTVGPANKKILTMTGGLRVEPNYSIRNAPQPNVIVVPAQSATDETRTWLHRAALGTDVTMSVCTGSFQLAGRACSKV